MKATLSDQASWAMSNGVSGHVCNCIGCCRKCGGCRTSPLHTALHCREVQRWRESYPKAKG